MENKVHAYLEKHTKTRMIAANGIIAALYVVLTLVTMPIAYSYMQFRLSEMLTLFVFFNPWYTIGLTLGCFLANLFSTVGPIDLALGTAATLVACLINIGLSKIVKILFINGLVPCIANAVIIPFDIYLSTLGTEEPMVLTSEVYFIMFGWIFLGEFLAIICVGYPIFMILMKKNVSFKKAALCTQNEEFKW